MIRFEIRHKDLAARVSRLKIGNKEMVTPEIFPVVHPSGEFFDVVKKFKPKAIITNAYLIYKNKKLREIAKNGIRNLLDFDGIIMTDSGSFQLFEYEKIDITNKEIIEFQNKLNVDIGVFLDIPVDPFRLKGETKKAVEKTIENAREAKKMHRKFATIATVQGGKYLDLRTYCAKKLSELDFDIYAIGGVVPFMESYDFLSLVKIIEVSKKNIPINKPVHLFGCGHPILFSLAVALGIDTFDSASYAIYAKDDRYLTEYGTLHLEDLEEFPCLCDVCSTYNPKELKNMDKKEREKLLAEHNLFVIFEEIKRIRQKIIDGELEAYLETRCRSHPYLLEALRYVYGINYLEELNPISKKSGFMYTGIESLFRVEVKRHLKKLERLEDSKNLVILPDISKPYYDYYRILSSRKYRFCIFSPVFTLIPIEIEEIYPLMQHEGLRVYSKEEIEISKRRLLEYLKKNPYDNVYVHSSLRNIFDTNDFEFFEEVSFESGDFKFKFINIANYIYGKGAGKILFDGNVTVEFSKTKRFRRVFNDGKLIGTVKNDGILALTLHAGEKLMKMDRNKIFVNDKAYDTIKFGRIYCSQIVDCSDEIEAGQDVLIVHEDRLLGIGKSVLNTIELKHFRYGVAVKVRHKYSSNK